ncbi:MAG: cellulase family glycosylhydrolase [Anaerolineales bacterium]|nr:cellulase family glycosylhydrolase [Anaerolineales bacterium]
MHTKRIIFLLIFGLLAACQQEPTPIQENSDVTTSPPDTVEETASASLSANVSPIMSPPAESTRQPATAASQSTLTAPAGQIFLPLASHSETAIPATTPMPTETAVGSTVVPSTPRPAYPPYDGPPIPRSNIGIQIHIHQEDQRDIIRHLQALDVGWVKEQVSWKVYEPQQGQYAADRFDELDRLVEAANNHGIQVLLSVSKAPEWSRATTAMDGPPTDYSHFQNFMHMLASRYQGQVAAYELWNEPNLQREWNGTPLNATDLVNLIAQGSAGVRAGDPAALIISAAPATTGINDGVVAIDDRVFLRQMLDAGVGNMVDGIGAHPYGWANPPDGSSTDANQTAPSHNDHPSFFFADTLQDYSVILAEYGFADKQIWVTEFGWGSFESFDALPPPGAEFMTAVSEWQQAEYIQAAYAQTLDNEQIGPMILWNLNFAPTLGPEYSESGYSILRTDGSRRPSYRVLEHLPKIVE